LLNILFIYKESEEGKENSSRVAFHLQHHWKPNFLKTLPTTAITKVTFNSLTKDLKWKAFKWAVFRPMKTSKWVLKKTLALMMP
jgi:hypothetical protein